MVTYNIGILFNKVFESLSLTKITTWRISKGDYTIPIFILRAFKDFRRLYRKLHKTSYRNPVNMTLIVD